MVGLCMGIMGHGTRMGLGYKAGPSREDSGAAFLPLCLVGVRRNRQRGDTAVAFPPDFG